MRSLSGEIPDSLLSVIGCCMVLRKKLFDPATAIDSAISIWLRNSVAFAFLSYASFAVAAGALRMLTNVFS
jgi:hypothetical protein